MIEVLAQEVFKPQFGLPGAPAGQTAGTSLLANLYKFLFGLGIVAAIISIIVAGAMYIFSGFGGAQPTATKKAQRRLLMTLVGLVILLSIDFIINQIDPGIKTPKLVLKKISKLTTPYVIPYDAGIPSLEGDLVGFIFLASETTTDWITPVNMIYIPKEVILEANSSDDLKLPLTAYLSSKFYYAGDRGWFDNSKFNNFCLNDGEVQSKIRNLHDVLAFIHDLPEQKEAFNNTLNSLIPNKGKDVLYNLKFSLDGQNFESFENFKQKLKNSDKTFFQVKFDIKIDPSSADMMYVKNLITQVNNLNSSIKFKTKSFLVKFQKTGSRYGEIFYSCQETSKIGEDDHPEAVLIKTSLYNSIENAVKWASYLANSCKVKLTITEAWPPSAKHIDSKHYNGKAIDISYKDAVDDDYCKIQSLAKFVQGLSAQNDIDVIAFEFNKANPNDPLGKCLKLLDGQAFNLDSPLSADILVAKSYNTINSNEFEKECKEPFKSLIKLIASSSMGWDVFGSKRGKIKFAGYEHVVGHPLHIEVK